MRSLTGLMIIWGLLCVKAGHGHSIPSRQEGSGLLLAVLYLQVNTMIITPAGFCAAWRPSKNSSQQFLLCLASLLGWLGFYNNLYNKLNLPSPLLPECL